MFASLMDRVCSHRLLEWLAEFSRIIAHRSSRTNQLVLCVLCPVCVLSNPLSALDLENPENATVNIAEEMRLATVEVDSHQVENSPPVAVSYGASGVRLETRSGNWQTNLQWRAQLRYTDPTETDPLQLDDLASDQSSNFEPRRLRLKIGGHGYRPWLKYHLEVDFEPNRDVDADFSITGARVLDWRVDLAKWDRAGVRVGQWKVDFNRERVDSSGRQQFVERSIVNRVFTIDRQVGIQLRGRLFEGTAADMRYFAGVFSGEGRGERRRNRGRLYSSRLQWNFLGRDLPARQSDVQFTQKATGSLAFAAATNRGRCTRWSSSGCGGLDGFLPPAIAAPGQYKVDQYVQEFAFKYRGLSLQQEYHQKLIRDTVMGGTSNLTGLYAQMGYFFHNLVPAWPAALELAARYAVVEEPNELDRLTSNMRREYTVGANWFFSGHRNKLSLDFSHLTINDGVVAVTESENRLRVQWDVSF